MNAENEDQPIHIAASEGGQEATMELNPTTNINVAGMATGKGWYLEVH